MFAFVYYSFAVFFFGSLMVDANADLLFDKVFNWIFR